MTPNNFIAIKLTFKRTAIIILFVFCIFITVLYVKQNRENRQLKFEINYQETAIRIIDSKVDNIENQNFNLEDRINDLESRVVDLE